MDGVTMQSHQKVPNFRCVFYHYPFVHLPSNKLIRFLYFLSLVAPSFSLPMTMHQPYANYPVYQPQSSYTTTTTSTSTTAPSSTTALESYYGSKYSAAGEETIRYNTARTLVAAAPPPPKKPQQSPHQTRNQYTKEQKSVLEKSYLALAYVSIRRREEMAQELNLTPKQVKVWYQNRRQKDKRRDLKLRKMQQQQQDHQPEPPGKVIKVPPSADSPDSGVQDVFNESNYQRHLIIKQEKYSPEKYQNAGQEEEEQEQKQTISPYSEAVINKVDPVASSLARDTLNYDEKYYSHGTSTAAASQYSHYDISQAFANYYNNYDYLQQYQYYQLMNGYQPHYSADPQEPQTYSGY